MIEYNWSPVGAIGNLAIQGGLAEYMKAQQARAFEAARQEDQQNHQAAIAAWEAQQQAAAQAAAAQRQAADDWRRMQFQNFQNAQDNAQQYWRQQAAFDRQREMQGAIDMRQQQRQQFDWLTGNVDATERDLMTQLSALGKTKLSDAGRAKYMGLMREFNALRAGRLKDNPPPNVYGTKLTEFANALASSGIEADIKPPEDPRVKPLLDPEGKPTGAFWIQHPDGKHDIFQPKKEAKEAPLPDFTQPDAANAWMNGRIYTDKETGARYQIKANGDLGARLDDDKAKEVDPNKQMMDRIEREQKLHAAAEAMTPPTKKTDPTTGKTTTELPTPEQIEATKEKLRQRFMPGSKDVEFMRKELQADPGALERFEALDPQEKEKQALKVRNKLEEEVLGKVLGFGSGATKPEDQFRQQVKQLKATSLRDPGRQSYPASGQGQSTGPSEIYNGLPIGEQWDEYRFIEDKMTTKGKTPDDPITVTPSELKLMWNQVPVGAFYRDPQGNIRQKKG